MKKTIKRFFEKNHFASKLLPIALILILAAIGYFSFSSSDKAKNISEAEAKTLSEDFVNAFLMADGSKANIVEVSEEYGLYKLKVDITSSIVESYLTKDGKLFFPQALNVEEMNSASDATGASAAPVATVSVKSDKPAIELFVMSHCPFGTQMEKGILPAVEALGDKVDFKIKFNSYAMHGETELKEQMAQHCIMTEQPKVFNNYLKCFLASGESAPCLASAKVDNKKLDSCVTKTDKEYKVMENFANKVGYQGSYPGFDISKADNEKYGVGGSPTLIINGQEIAASRDSASLLSTICSAFNNAPEECSSVLSSETPAPGFGTGTTATSNSAAACN